MIGSSRVCEESQELLEIDDEEFNQKKTVVEETDLEDGDVDVNNMEVVQRNKWTKMYSKQKAKGVQHPSYKYLVTIRKKEDREKLDAKPCHDCEKLEVSIQIEENILGACADTSIYTYHQTVTLVCGILVFQILKSVNASWPQRFITATDEK
ncbi:hypothetical protein EMCRGX_G010584 [Ephydatia muelleri]